MELKENIRVKRALYSLESLRTSIKNLENMISEITDLLIEEYEAEDNFDLTQATELISIICNELDYISENAGIDY